MFLWFSCRKKLNFKKTLDGGHNTIFHFGKHQELSVLAVAAVGTGIPRDGKLVAMAAATRQLHSQLKAYAAVENKPEFLKELVDAVDEFKRCCITAPMLADAASKTEGAFSQKLQELSLILEAYDALFGARRV